jgi:hypothetical protein
MASSSFVDPTLAAAPGPSRRALIAGVATAALLVAAAAIAVLAPGRDAERAPARYRPAGKAFSVVVPDGWRALRPAELRGLPESPAAVLRRNDGRGVVVVRERPALARNSRSLTAELTNALRRRFRGMRPVSARTVRLQGGPAYVYTFARPAAGRVQSVAVAPRGPRTYTLDAVAPAGAPDAAAQVGAILRSFHTPDPAPRP